MNHPEYLIKSSGLKATSARLKILNLFEQGDSRHLSAEDVYRLLMKEGLDVGIATVYRVLTQFENAGILIRHHFDGGNKAIFELSQGQHHDHLVCMKCGHVEEFCDSSIEAQQEKIATDRGFKLHAHSLYLYVECQQKDCMHYHESLKTQELP